MWGRRVAKSASSAEKGFGIITICWFASLNSKQQKRKNLKVQNERRELKLKQRRQLNESSQHKDPRNER